MKRSNHSLKTLPAARRPLPAAGPRFADDLARILTDPTRHRPLSRIHGGRRAYPLRNAPTRRIGDPRPDPGETTDDDALCGDSRTPPRRIGQHHGHNNRDRQRVERILDRLCGRRPAGNMPLLDHAVTVYGVGRPTAGATTQSADRGGSGSALRPSFQALQRARRLG